MHPMGSVELQILFCAMALGIVQLGLTVVVNLPTVGLPWAVGPRDEPSRALTKFGGRLARAWTNFLETFPLFAGAVLLAAALDRHTPWSVLGAQAYIWGRLFYVPLYVSGIPFLRTVAWTVATAGILGVLSAAWPG